TALGATAAVVVICGPFFALAPSAMWRMVFSEQLGRDQANPFRALVLLQRLPSGMSWPTAYLLDAVLLTTVGLLVVAAWRSPIVGLPTALLLSSVAVLMAAPSWFMFYVDYLTPALALAAATGATALGALAVEDRRLWIRGCAVAGATVVLLVLVGTAKAQWYRRGRRPSPLPPTQLASAVTGVRCVTSDSPMALIGLDALDRSLANGCVDWVDVTGRTYGPDMDVRTGDGERVPRVANQRWQLALRAYLQSGDAVVVARPKDAGISPATWDAIRSGGVLAKAGATTVYTVAFTDRGVPSP
ncbi:MAG: hypothetical protein JO148_15245, partial [Acidimicrobiia bacterium]|nr:hypothetical protein [Acidimicrobiia bacterium]